VDSLVKVGVPVAPIYSVDQVVDDPQVRHREMIASVEHPKAGTVRFPGFPIKFSKTPAEITRPALLLGQHNAEVLGELLGYGKEKIDDLRSAGVIT